MEQKIDLISFYQVKKKRLPGIYLSLDKASKDKTFLYIASKDIKISSKAKCLSKDEGLCKIKENIRCPSFTHVDIELKEW